MLSLLINNKKIDENKLVNIFDTISQYHYNQMFKFLLKLSLTNYEIISYCIKELTESFEEIELMLNLFKCDQSTRESLTIFLEIIDREPEIEAIIKKAIKMHIKT